jgi:phage/plasmid-associated DNA primase
LLKKITGGDEIMHEKKGKEPFFFVPFCKLLFSFNQLPLQLEEKSNAFYKRMRIVYMNKELFLNDDYVNDLCSPESIAETIPYLLSLLPMKDIPRTETSNKYVESLRQDSDSIHAFMTNVCHRCEDGFIPRTQLYEEYAKFCIDNGREGHKKHAFMRNLRSLGYKEIRDKKSREYCFHGLSFNDSVRK